MPTNEKRRAAVRRIIKERFDGRIVDFARSIERSRAQVWQFMNERSIGEKLARNIEAKLGLPHRALDGEQQSAPGFTADEVELIQKYRRSKAHWRAMLQQIAGMKHQQQTLSEALTILLARVNPKKRSKQKK